MSKPTTQKRLHRPVSRLVLIATIATVMAIGASVVLRSGDRAAASYQEEFIGAYPLEIASNGTVVEVELRAQAAVVDLVDVGPTEVWTYNGQVPGPEIRVGLGDTIRAMLVNDLSEPTTIHWHGVRVPNDMDGVPGVNQQVIQPGDSFVYQFTPPDAGTFWFHSHANGSEQLERGLHGSLVVEDADALGYSQDVVWMIDDWILESDGALFEGFNQVHDITHNGRWGNVVTTNGATNTTLRGAPGERVRLRLINASNARTYAPEFGALDARIIAVDGMLTAEPIPAEGFILAPGNRIDIDLVVPAQDQPTVIADNFNGEGFFIGAVVGDGEPVVTPDFAPPRNVLTPEWAGAVDAPIDLRYVVSLASGPDGSPQWQFNGSAFPDGEPEVLTQNAFTKISILNDSQMLHPIHLHGQFFKLISRNGEAGSEGHFRDTVLLMPGETLEIGLVALDVGTWALHCHIQEHAEAGMMTTFTVNEAR